MRGEEAREVGSDVAGEFLQTSFRQPVGRHRPKTWGLHDFNGNVWEWVEDYARACTVVKAEISGGQGHDHTSRFLQLRTTPGRL